MKVGYWYCIYPRKILWTPYFCRILNYCHCKIMWMYMDMVLIFKVYIQIFGELRAEAVLLIVKKMWMYIILSWLQIKSLCWNVAKATCISLVCCTYIVNFYFKCNEPSFLLTLLKFIFKWFKLKSPFLRVVKVWNCMKKHLIVEYFRSQFVDVFVSSL